MAIDRPDHGEVFLLVQIRVHLPLHFVGIHGVDGTPAHANLRSDDALQQLVNRQDNMRRLVKAKG
jgi:hypothetical protein